MESIPDSSDAPPQLSSDWLSAAAISARSGGRVSDGTIRSWWRATPPKLPFHDFPELGKKSTRRSHWEVVDRYLGGYLHNYTPPPSPSATENITPTSVATPLAEMPPWRLADLYAALESTRSAAAAAMDAVLAEAESHAKISQAIAESDAKRVESLRHLRTVMRSQDLTVAAFTGPPAPPLSPGFEKLD